MENSKLFKESLNSLKSFNKEQLLEEMEQILLCFLEGQPSKEDSLKSLKSLNDFWKKGGLRQK